MTRYPDGLPKPIRDDYGFEDIDWIVRTKMDSGRARQRVEFDSKPTNVSVTFLFTAPEARLYEAWVSQVAKADWWTFPVLSPIAYQDEEVRFAGTPSAGVLIGVDRWRFTAVLEVREKPLVVEGWAELLPEYILYADIFDYAMNREWPLVISYALITQDDFILTTEDGFGLTTE
jgi:hypothetical protein